MTDAPQAPDREGDQLEWTRLILRVREGEFTDKVRLEVQDQVNSSLSDETERPTVDVPLPHARLTALAGKYRVRDCVESARLVEELKSYGVVSLDLRRAERKDLVRLRLDQIAAKFRESPLEVVQVGVDVAPLTYGTGDCYPCSSEKSSQELQNGLKVDPRRLARVSGADPRIVDVERGWAFGHPCLKHLKQKPAHGENAKEKAHGANVLSLLAASGANCFGIAPGVEIRLSSVIPKAGGPCNEMAAIVEGLLLLDRGDVLLLEIQQFTASKVYVPAEFLVPVWKLLRAATLCDTVVVEAAGNSGLNLDLEWPRMGVQGGWDDSGAILVGATKNKLEGDGHYARWPCSNFASRVKVFSWGDGVTAAGATVGDTDCFTATSAATAIVAGCSIVAQRHALTMKGRRLEAIELREILETTGTPAGDGGLGRLPDLVAIENAIANLP